MPPSLPEQCNAIEECYEYMLAYAGQGVPGEEGPSQIRAFLTKAADALAGLTDSYVEAVGDGGEPYHQFLTVLASDSFAALASVRLVLAQPRIGSQLIDNLNASIHLRALLTDLFLIDEILKARAQTENAAAV